MELNVLTLAAGRSTTSSFNLWSGESPSVCLGIGAAPAPAGGIEADESVVFPDPGVRISTINYLVFEHVTIPGARSGDNAHDPTQRTGS